MSFASVKSSTAIFVICAGLNGSLFAQSPDPFQPDIPAPLVAKVDDAKEKQVDNRGLPAAEAELQDVIKQRPDYYRALFNLGLVYQAQGKNVQALQKLEEAKSLRDKLHISDSSILNSIGWVYMNAGKLDKAESSFLEALKEGHEDKASTQRLLNNLGYLYLQKGDTAKSRFYLGQAANEYQSTGTGRLFKMADQYDVIKKSSKKVEEMKQ
jgi:Tfp pilus assembly protein PilF